MNAIDKRAAHPDQPDPGGFIRKLMMEVAVGDIHLPSFPDIAARVQKVLEDPKSGAGRVAVVISSEAALAARVLRLANSAFLNPSSEQVNDLKVALTRLGVQLVRCTAVSFALQQMQSGVKDPKVRARLHELWRDGALIAAIAYVLARETRSANPDEALLTGLMHNIGKLYIALHAPPGIESATPATWRQLVSDAHPQIAVTILEHWKFAPEIIAAVRAQNQRDAVVGGLTDVLIGAKVLVPCVVDRQRLPEVVERVGAFKRLKLTAENCNQILAGSADQIRSLRAGLFD